MLVNDLMSKVLLEPYQRGADQLKVLTGYASAAMARRHFLKADGIRQEGDMGLTPLSVEVIYGMAKLDGVPRSQHQSFVSMVEQRYLGRFSCHYVIDPPPIHAKAYIWLRENEPFEAYLGSANYTQAALLRQQIEVMDQCDAIEALELFEASRVQALECDHDDVDSQINLYRHDDVPVNASETVTLSFLTRAGETPTKSGINWGQRGSRNRNEADLRVPAPVARQGFFPPRRVQFTMNTDDGFSMLCVVAQDNDKGILTTESNAILGEYIRRRLGLYNGEYVYRSHFEEYGRSDVTIYKIDDETYHMDFSVRD